MEWDAIVHASMRFRSVSGWNEGFRAGIATDDVDVQMFQISPWNGGDGYRRLTRVPISGLEPQHYGIDEQGSWYYRLRHKSSPLLISVFIQ